MITLRITATVGFDGITPLDLSAAVYDPAIQRYEISAAQVGLLQLGTFQPLGGPRGVWIQKAFGLGFPAPTLSLAIPSGSELGPLPFETPWNVWVPQGVLLKLDSGNTPGSTQIWTYGINDKNYAPLACCHQFAPREQVIPGPGPGG